MEEFFFNTEGKFKIVRSYKDKLEEDTERKYYEPNRTSREVKSGHYVEVKPTVLPNAKLVIHSEELSEELGFDILTDQAIKFLSGDNSSLPEFDFSSYIAVDISLVYNDILFF